MKRVGLHRIADDLGQPGWIFWDWTLFNRWRKAWTRVALLRLNLRPML